MVKGLVLVSHGNFAGELKNSAEMIMGPQDNIFSVALLPQEGVEDFKKKFEDTVAPLDDYVVYADLMGGTPSNVVSKMIIEGQDIDLYTGMNLPMVIDFITSVLVDGSADPINASIKNTKHVNEVIGNNDSDDDEM